MADLHRTARVLDALANPNRLRILQRVKRKQSMKAGEVADVLRVSPSTASQHLTILTDAGILKRTKQGRFVSYRLAMGGEKWVKQLLREGV